MKLEDQKPFSRQLQAILEFQKEFGSWNNILQGKK